MQCGQLCDSSNIIGLLPLLFPAIWSCWLPTNCNDMTCSSSRTWAYMLESIPCSSTCTRSRRNRRRAVIGFEIPVTRARIRCVERSTDDRSINDDQKLAEMSSETRITKWSTACLEVGERKQLNQPRSWWNRVKHEHARDVQPKSDLRFLSNVLLQDVVKSSQTTPRKTRKER